MIYFTSDLHFNHKKIIEYEKESRGHFTSIEEMNKVLIDNWNATVKDEDTVYVLGDVFMRADNLEEIMAQLNGRKVLIRGNHDTNKITNRLVPYFEGIYDMYNLKVDKKMYVLCHYPIREWQHKENGSVHLYGHVHSNEHRNGFLTEPNSYHIGVDTNNLKPISIDEIKKLLNIKGNE